MWQNDRNRNIDQITEDLHKTTTKNVMKSVICKLILLYFSIHADFATSHRILSK